MNYTKALALSLLVTVVAISCSGTRKADLVIPRPVSPPDKVDRETEVYAFQIPLHPPDPETLAALRIRAADQPDDAQLQRTLGTVFQVLSPPDNWAFLDQAIIHLERALELMPGDPQTLMYLGQATAAKAQNPKVMLLAKLQLARKGFKLMDASVEGASRNLSLRILRGNASMLAPPILRRADPLKADHAFITRATEQADTPAHLKVLGLIFLGDHAHRILKDGEKAATWYRRALDFETGYTDIARSRLGLTP